ncbi:hypothetical protein Tco_1140948 [Tanacetum coccineum]
MSDIGSPRVDGPPVMPENPYAYVVAAFQGPPSPDYVPCYVPESDPEEDPKEEDDEDPEEDPADYPTDGGDDGDDEDESSDDDKDDDVDIKEEEEEEHQLISIRDDPHTPFWSDTEIARLLAIPTPPPSPLSSWSSLLPQIPSPPLPLILSPLHVSSPPPASPIRLLGYRATMIRLRVEAPSTSHSLPLPPPIILSHTRSDAPSSGTPPFLPIPAPTSSPPLLPPSTNRRKDIHEVTLLPRKRLGIALGPRYKVKESSSTAATRPIGGSIADYAAPATDDTELGRRMTEFVTRVRQDTDEIYTRLDDEQTERQLMAGRLNMLYRDRRAHARIGLLMERETRMSREA